MGAADEVPPHHDLLAERRPAEQHEPARLEGLDRQGRAPGLDVRELGRLDLLAVDDDRAGVEEDAVLEGLVDVELEGRAGLEHQLGAEQGRRRTNRRGVAEQRAEEHAGLPAGTGQHRRRVVLEVGRARRARRREARPRAGRRAAWSCRRVETSEWLTPRPPVIRLSSPGRTRAWWPAESRCSISPANSQLTVCRAGVGVRRDDHAAGLVDLVGSVVVGEAPRADQGALALREGTAHAHRPEAAERYVAWGRGSGHESLPDVGRLASVDWECHR